MWKRVRGSNIGHVTTSMTQHINCSIRRGGDTTSTGGEVVYIDALGFDETPTVPKLILPPPLYFTKLPKPVTAYDLLFSSIIYIPARRSRQRHQINIEVNENPGG